MEIAAHLYLETTDVNKADEIAYCTQCLLKYFNEAHSGTFNEIFKSLKPETQREIGPLRNTKFTFGSEMPIVINDEVVSQSNNVTSFNDWTYQLFATCLESVCLL